MELKKKPSSWIHTLPSWIRSTRRARPLSPWIRYHSPRSATTRQAEEEARGLAEGKEVEDDEVLAQRDSKGLVQAAEESPSPAHPLLVPLRRRAPPPPRDLLPLPPRTHCLRAPLPPAPPPLPPHLALLSPLPFSSSLLPPRTSAALPRPSPPPLPYPPPRALPLPLACLSLPPRLPLQGRLESEAKKSRTRKCSRSATAKGVSRRWRNRRRLPVLSSSPYAVALLRLLAIYSLFLLAPAPSCTSSRCPPHVALFSPLPFSS